MCILCYILSVCHLFLHGTEIVAFVVNPIWCLYLFCAELNLK
jgi:hypothetical protein